MGTEERVNQGSSPNLGPQIRGVREQHRLSLRALADRCGLSTNAISLIERGEHSPSIATLHKLATALGMRITDFFQQTDEHAVVFTDQDDRLVANGPGFVMECLAIGLRNQQIEPFVVTIEPESPKSGVPVVHSGQEFVYCLNGSLRYRIGEKTYYLGPGDSLLFEANQAHCFWNDSSIPAQILLIFQATEGGDLARRRHMQARDTTGDGNR
ncbi:MAG: cupin domain-containing protein [Spirochaetaceae bacterium]|nr:MAG: cupin domain-containing protein [Spirochaetaceae bacterium]